MTRTPRAIDPKVAPDAPAQRPPALTLLDRFPAAPRRAVRVASALVGTIATAALLLVAATPTTASAVDVFGALRLPGEAVDFWRVESIERGSFLRLRAEMRVPGRAWLELGASPAPDDAGSDYRQRAVFFPKGLSGRLYWWAIFPFHGIIFSGMANRITAEAEAAARARELEVTKR